MFIDYLKAGHKLNLSVCVDFSFHNGQDNNNKSSLHYVDPRKKNVYEQCLYALTPKLLSYSDDSARIYGFSAVAKPNEGIGNEVSQSFPLTYDINDHNVNGLIEMVKAYHKASRMIRPSGPPVRGVMAILGRTTRSCCTTRGPWRRTSSGTRGSWC